MGVFSNSFSKITPVGCVVFAKLIFSRAPRKIDERGTCAFSATLRHSMPKRGKWSSLKTCISENNGPIGPNLSIPREKSLLYRPIVVATANSGRVLCLRPLKLVDLRKLQKSHNTDRGGFKRSLDEPLKIIQTFQF